jgi:hypothetical protein
MRRPRPVQPPREGPEGGPDGGARRRATAHLNCTPHRTALASPNARTPPHTRARPDARSRVPNDVGGHGDHGREGLHRLEIGTSSRVLEPTPEELRKWETSRGGSGEACGPEMDALLTGQESTREANSSSRSSKQSLFESRNTPRLLRAGARG